MDPTSIHMVGVKGYSSKIIMNRQMQPLKTKIMGYYIMDPEMKTPYLSVNSPYINRAYYIGGF